MLSQVFQRLAFFEPVEGYRYIGFGSTTFADFILFHRTLDIKDMISIERREEYQARFEYNKPFHCIQMKYGDSNQVLPQLTWEKRVIVWLDYEDPLRASFLQDMALVSTKARSGSVLIVTVNAESPKLKNMAYKKAEQLRKKFLMRDLQLEALPPWVKGKHLEGDELAKTYRRFILDCIAGALGKRNILSSPQDKTDYRSLFNFVYKDGTRMLTVGVILFQEHDKGILEQCEFEDLDYVTFSGNEPFEIKMPVITTRERHFLNQRLPYGTSTDGIDIGLTKDEIENYARLYRYCPSFAEVELS